MKRKASFIVESMPMFKTLQDISVAIGLNPVAQISLSLYFEIFIPTVRLITYRRAHNVKKPKPIKFKYENNIISHKKYDKSL